MKALAFFIVLGTAMCVTCLGVGSAAYKDRDAVIKIDGSVPMTSHFSVRDMQSIYHGDIGSMTLPYATAHVSHLVSADKTIDVNQLLTGHRTKETQCLLAFNETGLYETTIEPSLFNTQYMPLKGGTMKGDMDCVDIVNVSLLNQRDANSLMVYDQPLFTLPSLLLFGKDHSLVDSKILPEHVVTCNTDTERYGIASVDSHYKIKSGINGQSVIRYHDAVKDRIAKTEHGQLSSLELTTLVTREEADSKYVRRDNSRFQNPIHIGKLIQTKPPIYGIYALTNQPLAMENQLRLSGLVHATPFLTSEWFTKDEDGVITYLGPKQLVRVSFGFTTNARQEFATLSVTLKVGLMPVTNQWTFSVKSSTLPQAMNVTNTHVMQPNDTITIHGDYTGSSKLFLLSHVSLQIS